MTYRIFLILFFICCTTLVRAEATDPNALQQLLMQQQQMLESQQKMLTQMQAKIAELEAKQVAMSAEPNMTGIESKVAALQDQQLQNSRQQEAMSQKMEYIQNGEITWPKGMEWVKNVKFKGDLRTRYEYIDEENSDNRNRARIRARFGFDAKVHDDVDMGMRFATSEVWGDDETSGDPVSTNQTLDDAFSKKSIWLDLAYFNWHPKDISGLNVIGGKMENPFYRVGQNQLIFDSDLTPEGLAVQYVRPLTDSGLELFINVGGFYVDEVKSGADTSLFAGQLGLKQTFEDKSYLAGGASLYGYSNLEGHDALVTVDGTEKFFGNSNSDGVYTNDYDLVEFFGEYGFNICKTPAAIFASYVQNTVAVSDQDTGWLVGASLNKLKDLEKDAVLGVFSDSDFIGGGTNGKGHRIGAGYQLTKNIQTNVTYFMDEKGNDEHDYDRFQADVIFKF